MEGMSRAVVADQDLVDSEFFKAGCEEILRCLGHEPDEVLFTDESSILDFYWDSNLEERFKYINERLPFPIEKDMKLTEYVTYAKSIQPNWPKKTLN